MNDESKTIADLLKAIDDKTVDRAEVMPMLQSIERNTSANTGKAIATAVGTAVTKAMEKTVGSKKVAPEPAKAKATSKAASVAPAVAAVAQALCANIAETFTSLLITVEGGEVLHYGSSNY